MSVEAPPPYGILAIVQGGSAGFSDSLIGVTVRGRYRLEEVRSSSVHTTVFRATHLPSGQNVALKMLAPDASTDARSAFETAASVVQDLDHPQIPRTRDRGESEDGLSFIVSDFLEGCTLDRLETPVEWSKAVKFITQTLEGLRYLHSRDVIHRSLCPANLFLAGADSDTQQVKILDFGHARTGLEAPVLTVSGLDCGAPGYLAPEQISGGQTDHRVDLYAVGVIGYELLTAQKAWPAGDDDAVLEHQMANTIPALPGSLSVFDQFLQRLCARDPTDRFSSAASALDALEAAVLACERPLRGLSVTSGGVGPSPGVGRDTKRRGPRWPWIGAGALGLTIVLVLGLGPRNNSPSAPATAQEQPGPERAASDIRRTRLRTAMTAPVDVRPVNPTVTPPPPPPERSIPVIEPELKPEPKPEPRRRSRKRRPGGFGRVPQGTLSEPIAVTPGPTEAPVTVESQTKSEPQSASRARELVDAPPRSPSERSPPELLVPRQQRNPNAADLMR